MTRFRPFALPLLVCLLLTGCGGGEIARVNDRGFTLADIDDLYESPAVEGVEFRQALFRVMAVEVLEQALSEDFGITLAESDIDARLAELEATLEEQGQTAAEYLGVPDASPAMLRFNAEVLELHDRALDRLVVDPEVVDGLLADPATLTTICSRHILVATEQEALDAMARVQAGEDFAAVADEVSLDTHSEGGDLGCVSGGALTPEFSAAAMAALVGEVAGPVASESGYHVVLVYERTSHSREEYLADPYALLTQDDISSIWSEWFNAQLQEADGWVAERYGVWTPIGVTESPAG